MISLSDETESLAHRLARARHVTVEEAVRQALEAHAHATGLSLKPGGPRDPSLNAAAERRARVDRIVGEITALPVLDARSAREITDDLNEP